MAAINSAFERVSVPEFQSLPDYFLSETRKFGDQIAIIWPPQNKTYTFNEVKRLVCQLSAGLQLLGLKKGDVVGTFMSNCPEFILLFLAAQRLGAIITTCNPAYTPAELLHQFQRTNVQYLVTEPEFIGTVNEVRNQLALKESILLHATDAMHGYRRFDDIFTMAKGLSDAVNLPRIDPRKDPSFILFSSGTTGLPKGVMVSHYDLYCNSYIVTRMRGSEPMLKLSPADVALDVFPFFHAGGLCLGILWTLVQGCSLVILPKYEPRLFLNTIVKYKVTTLVLVPPIVVFLAKSPIVSEYNLSSVRNVLTAGAPLPPQPAQDATKRLGIKHLIQMYGMTELSVVSHCQPISALSKTKPGTVGVVIPNTKSKIVDPNTFETLGEGKIGEIWVHSPSNMIGYLHNQKATDEMILPDGWLRTGDMGRFDKDGYFFIEDRLKELIKVRGFQVAPAELEALILTHPKVDEVIVIGVPDPYSGELPRAYCVLKPGTSASEQEIQDFVKPNVTRYKQLKAGVRFVDELPKTASGKLLRRQLRDQARMEVKAKI